MHLYFTIVTCVLSVVTVTTERGKALEDIEKMFLAELGLGETPKPTDSPVHPYMFAVARALESYARQGQRSDGRKSAAPVRGIRITSYPLVSGMLLLFWCPSRKFVRLIPC